MHVHEHSWKRERQVLNPFIFFQMFSMVQWAIELYVALTCPPEHANPAIPMDM